MIKAFLFGTNKTTLCKLFKEYINCTFIDYVNRLKIQKARKLLLEFDLPVKKISEYLNINDPKYFNTLFFKHTSIMPIQYRKNAK